MVENSAQHWKMMREKRKKIDASFSFSFFFFAHSFIYLTKKFVSAFAAAAGPLLTERDAHFFRSYCSRKRLICGRFFGSV